MPIGLLMGIRRADNWTPSRHLSLSPSLLLPVTMPPAAAVIPDVSVDAFRTLFPADHVAAITPRDSFLCTEAAWNPLAHELLLTLHHQPSGVLCAGCPADDAFLGSVCLRWAAATDSLAHFDMESLRNHADQTSWLT